jgi:NitT/TauT family transport system ATP-binding protein
MGETAMSALVAQAVAALGVRRVTKSFGAKDGQRVVLDGVSFEVPERAITAIVGPSGCGKTTLIDIIAGFTQPTSGSITLRGAEVQAPGIDRLVVFQENALFPWLTVLENVAFGPIATGAVSPARARAEAEKLLESMGLRDVGARYPNQLSGGMQRRVELARALVNRPDVLLLDEPFRGLDALTRRIMQRSFLAIHDADPRTTLIVSSELDEAVLLADYIVILSQSPAHVLATIEIDIPRPRPADVTQTLAYREALANVTMSLSSRA